MRRITVLLSVMVLVLGMTGMAAIADDDRLWDAEDEIDDAELPVEVSAREISGVIHHDAPKGDTIDGQAFLQGETANTYLAVKDLVNDDGRALHLVFDGSGPTDDGFQPGEDICASLLTADSCTTIEGAVGSEEPFDDDTVFLEGDDLTVNPGAELGDWDLRWSVIDADTGDAYFSETFTITVDEEELAATITLAGDDQLTVSEAGEYDVEVTNTMEYRDLDDWKLGLSVENLEDEGDVTIEWYDGQEDEYRDIDEVDQIATSFDSDENILWVLGAEEETLEPGETMKDEFRATFHTDGEFTGTAYVIDTSND